MRIFALLLCAMILSACDLARDEEENVQHTYEVRLYGSMEVLPDNSLRLYHGRGMAEVSAAGEYSGVDLGQASSAGSGSPLLPDALRSQGLNQLVPIGEGRYIVAADGRTWVLDGNAGNEYVELGIPEGSGWPPRVDMGDRFDACSVDGNPVILYNSQFVQAYDSALQPVWRFNGDAGSYLLRADDDDRFAVGCQSGSLHCLGPQGELIWKRMGCFSTLSMGDRLVTLDNRGNLLCIDWGGKELWQVPLVDMEFPRLLTEPRSPLCVVGSGQFLHAYDREGKEQWVYDMGDEFTSPYYISPDGYVFIWRIYWGSGRDLFVERFTTGNRLRDSRWSCIDPQGRFLWSSTKTASHNGNYLPGYDGRLYVYERKPETLVCLDPVDSTGSQR